MKRTLLFLLLTIPVIGLCQPNENAVVIAKEIKSDDICEYVNKLASEEFAGRETGKESLIVAANYIADKFKEYGVSPGNNGSYFQNYPLRLLSSKSLSLKFNGEEVSFLKEYFTYPDDYKSPVNSNSIIFAGYGIKTEAWDDYQNLEAEGRVVMILGGEPFDKKGNSVITGSKEE
ncbi:MAG: hypothetical protein HKN22_01015, partial [Bacteroidia bacterium]|nr:hypothetical protein [Bacteroidia bacterium]